MWGQIHFGGLVKALHMVCLAKLGRVVYILKYHNHFRVGKTCTSSRPRELPPQPLTDPDVNLPIHPAPIDQPPVPQIASAQTYEASVLQCTEEGQAPCVCDRATFCISDKPIAAMRG